MILLRIKGLTALTQRLQKSAKAVQKSREVVKTHGAKLEKTMKRNATFVKGYQTGETKRSINLQLKDAGFKAEVKPTTDYSGYLELGTRYMGAQPFVSPSLMKIRPGFIKDMEKASKGE